MTRPPTCAPDAGWGSPRTIGELAGAIGEISRHVLRSDFRAINPGEAVEEKVSLSDRFGLWLGFHRCSQDEFLEMVHGYVKHYRIPAEPETLRAEALEWATTRGSRSGRVAWQYVQDLAGRLGVPLQEPAAPR